MIWLLTAYGWTQALNVANDTSFYHGEINIPPFFSTLLALPLPYGVYGLFKYLGQKHPLVPWKMLLDRLIISTLMIVLFVQGLVFCLIAVIWIYGGGLDIMLSWETDVILSAVLDSLPITVPVTVITVLVFVGFKKRDYANWLLLPAIVTNGIVFFKLAFLLWGMKA
jgi:hypothetical protein